MNIRLGRDQTVVKPSVVLRQRQNTETVSPYVVNLFFLFGSDIDKKQLPQIGEQQSAAVIHPGRVVPAVRHSFILLIRERINENSGRRYQRIELPPRDQFAIGRP